MTLIDQLASVVKGFSIPRRLQARFDTQNPTGLKTWCSLAANGFNKPIPTLAERVRDSDCDRFLARCVGGRLM
jgi:hypothetical protein